VQREHSRVRRILGRINRRGASNKLRLVQDEIVDAEKSCARRVEVVDRDDVLVIIRPADRLVWQMVRVSYRVDIERACWVVACRDRYLDVVG